MAILTVYNLQKNYGSIRALKGINFSVPKGSVFGILGPNGSGKTTLLGIIMNVLKPSAGSYELFDETPNDNHRKQMGTLLETPNFYPYLSGLRNLKIASSIKQHGEEDIDNVLEIVNLTNRKNSAFNTYSLGMKQRLAIGSTLLGNPEVLVFDEPTNGLDPVGIAEIRTLIKKLSKQGKTIIMASHLLDEVEKVCTHVAILKQGTIVASGNVDEIFLHEDIVEIGASDSDRLNSILSGMKGYTKLLKDNNYFHLYYISGHAKLDEINNYCFNNGITVSHLRLKKKSLESKFFALTN